MKIILSRKGFDSGNSDMPSAFVRGGEMVSFPIPTRERTKLADLIRYNDIRVEGMSMVERIKQLRGNRKKPFKHEFCHHDPDLIRDSRDRPSLAGWRGILGQSKNAQTDLETECVDVGDLFLFFGWFKEAEQGPNGLRFLKGAPHLHAFFGYLQIGEIFPVRADQRLPDKYGCFADHPHLTQERLELQQRGNTATNDTVYIAAESLSLDSKLPGWGVFQHSSDLVLTKKGRTRAFWSLPDFLQGQKIGRLRKDAWTSPDGAFRSPDIGQQEIIINADDNLKKWALERIRAGTRTDEI